MGQPNPPGDMPLVEGLGPEWNEFVSFIPEDKRSEYAPKLKERVTSLTSQYEPLKQWEDLHKSGVTPDQAGTALTLFSMIENNPQEVYKTIGEHLGISPQEAKVVADAIEDDDGEDPRIAQMAQQIEVLSQIQLAERQQAAQQKLLAEQEATVDKEIKDAMAKLGDVPEDEIVMRMLHKGMTAEEAHNEYTGRVAQAKTRRPAPMVMSASGSAIPARAIDPTKLDNRGTRDLVAQMLEHANNERKN